MPNAKNDVYMLKMMTNCLCKRANNCNFGAQKRKFMALYLADGRADGVRKSKEL